RRTRRASRALPRVLRDVRRTQRRLQQRHHLGRFRHLPLAVPVRVEAPRLPLALRRHARTQAWLLGRPRQLQLTAVVAPAARLVVLVALTSGCAGGSGPDVGAGDGSSHSGVSLATEQLLVARRAVGERWTR